MSKMPRFSKPAPRVINGVTLTRNNTPGALFPVCTRVNTSDGWSIPRFFFNASEAEVYAEMAPFANESAEILAFNTVRSATYVNEALIWNKNGQPNMALHYAALVDLYTVAGDKNVSDSDVHDIEWMKKDKLAEKAAPVLAHILELSKSNDQ